MKHSLVVRYTLLVIKTFASNLSQVTIFQKVRQREQVAIKG